MENIMEINEKNFSNSLGVSITRDGLPFYFGDKHNGSHFHGERFKIDVIPSIASNIYFDNNWSDFQIYSNVASQGVITLCNMSSSDKIVNSVLIFSPDTLTDDQIRVMNTFCDKYLDECSSVVVALVDGNGQYQHFTLDDYVNSCLVNREVHVKK